MRLAAFIDYDNLHEQQRNGGLLAVITKALLQLPATLPISRGSCDIRIYGGWYEEKALTSLAERLIARIQAEFPAVVRIPREKSDPVSVRVSAELAMSLLEEPAHLLFNTYRKKGKPANLRVQQPASVGCVDPTCPLPHTRKLLKTGNCPISTCTVIADDLVYRHEQKIVDTMLACDLLHSSSQGFDFVILISGDDDFLPPLRSLVLRGVPVFRFHPRPNGMRASFLSRPSQLVEMDL